MQKQISNRRIWIWLTLLLLLVVLSSYFIQTNEPAYYPSYVSDSPSPSGVKALYTYLKSEQDVGRWNHPPAYLTNHSGHELLIMIEPSTALETKEMKEYIDFMEAGNTILLVKQNPKGLFGVETVPMQEYPDKKEGINIHTKEGKGYQAEIQSGVRLQTEKHDEILIYDKSGTTAYKHSFGNGHLIVANTPEWLTNGKLLKDDHIPLILALINEANPSRILFDEYTHDTKQASKLLKVYPKWFVLFLLQFLLMVVLWLWFKGKRFGPIFIPREESVRYSDERIRALSAWYLRGHLYHDAIVIQADYVKYLIQEQWGIPYNMAWKDITSQIERKSTKFTKPEIQSFLNDLCKVLTKEKISKQEFLLWSKRLDRLQKEVEQG